MGETMLPAHYRARAAAIRSLAGALRDPRERARFFDFAIEYEKLAVYAQGREKTIARLSPSSDQRRRPRLKAS